ncbi:MAG: thioredoxin family protein [Blastocatellia bacterium]
MKKTSALILGTVVASVAICALTSAQSSPARRTPVLTTDDLGSAPREVVPIPVENDVPPFTKPAPDGVGGPIVWHRDLRRALEVARADGKLVVADVYTDWCGWCKKMDKIIYSDPAIAAMSRQEIFVKVNAEDEGEGQNFARQMRVKGFPTTIILDGNGRVLNITQGYIASPQAFAELVQAARAQTR